MDPVWDEEADSQDEAPLSLHANRRTAFKWLAGLGIGSVAFQRALAASFVQGDDISLDMIRAAQWVADIELNEEQQKEVATSLQQLRAQQQALRKVEIDPDTPLAMVFMPAFFAEPMANAARPESLYSASALPVSGLPVSGLPASTKALSLESPELPFASVSELGRGLRDGRWTSLQLAEIYLARLKKYDPLLHCVIELTEDRAMEQAKRADDELKRGVDRGPLHGIPWGAKDLIAVPGHRTTWGANPYRDRVIDREATVASRLRDAGAVLLAKLSLGTLAWGEIWHDAVTRNPWNPSQGSSGSSAGSASAAVAGLCGFTIGSETLGSIVSPTRRCRVTGLRPTFGRISRYGCMTLSWSMDKIGPITRHVEDCALVFAAIAGSDGRDPSVVDRPFHWPHQREIKGLKLGVIGDRPSKLEQQAIEYLTSQGAELVPISFPNSVPEFAMLSALGCEAATMHEDLFRSGVSEKDLGKWGPTFREAQWTRAIHYLRGMRTRTTLIRETEQTLREVDLLLGSEDLIRTNLSGHPSLVVAFGKEERNGVTLPGTIKLTTRLFGEETLLFVGDMLQRAFPPEPSQPPLETFLADLAKYEKSELDLD